MLTLQVWQHLISRPLRTHQRDNNGNFRHRLSADNSIGIRCFLTEKVERRKITCCKKNRYDERAWRDDCFQETNEQSGDKPIFRRSYWSHHSLIGNLSDTECEKICSIEWKVICKLRNPPDTQQDKEIFQVRFGSSSKTVAAYVTNIWLENDENPRRMIVNCHHRYSPYQISYCKL